jgi:hypothetical protein
MRYELAEELTKNDIFTCLEERMTEYSPALKKDKLEKLQKLKD